MICQIRSFAFITIKDPGKNRTIFLSTILILVALLRAANRKRSDGEGRCVRNTHTSGVQ